MNAVKKPLSRGRVSLAVPNAAIKTAQLPIMNATATAYLTVDGALSTWGKVSPGIYSAIAIILIVLFSGASQGIESDTAWQVRALIQNRQGDSPTFNTLVTPNPADLSRDIASWIVWWAPGNGILISAAMRLGLTVGVVVRLLAIVCLVAGAGGWAFWIASFSLNRWVRLLLSACLPWSVYAHNAVFYYGAETLLFAATPWALVATLVFVKRLHHDDASITLGGLSGALLGLLYVFKYTGGFVVLGAVGFVLFQMAGRVIFRHIPRRVLWSVGLFLVLALIPALSVNLINSVIAHTMNLVSARVAFRWNWETLLFGLANPILALANAGSLFRQIFDVIHLQSTSIDLFSGMLALIGAVGLWPLACRTFPSRLNGQLSCFVLLSSVGSLAVIWTISSSVSYESRHIAMASIAMLPYLAERASSLTSKRVKVFLAACGFVYVLLPSSYGVVAVLGKAIRHARYQTGPSGVYNPFLSDRDAAGVRALLVRDFSPAFDVWYVINPVAAADLPGRVLVRRANDLTLSELQKEKFYSGKPVRVRLLLPNGYERDGVIPAGAWMAGVLRGARAACLDIMGCSVS